ncbi:MAG: autotransporter-associated beta strand repeat-containing protein, partial [Thermoguttaceae bacterium]|nr:autotransporter-associated beta strand repeat-containing protein [Thermoguttaceae bacterium]
KSDASDLVVNVILGNKSEGFVTNNSLTKTGAGTMELTAANEYSGGTTVSGGVLKLTGAGTLGTGAVTVNENGTLEFNVASGPDKTVAVGTGNKVTGTGQIVKTGDGTLKIDAAQNCFNASTLTVKEGRLDMKEYFTGQLAVNNGAAFSPGNSVGTLNLDGDLTLGETGGGDYAQLIMEIGGASTDKNDALIVTGDLNLTNGKIYLTLADACELAPGDSFTMTLSANNSAQLKQSDFITTYVSSSVFTDLTYEPLSGGTFVITGTLDANAVPEPSAWVLLAFGIIGLFLRKWS